MTFTSWRGRVGIVYPTMRPGGLEETIRILPPGISLLPLYNNVRTGKRDEMQAVIAAYDEKVHVLAEAGVDIIHPAGAPPFMLQGVRKERELVRRWTELSGRPVFTTSTLDRQAMRALGIHRFIGMSYLGDDVNPLFAQYFRDAGFDCIDVKSIGIPFDRMQELAETEIYRFARSLFLAHPDVDGIYLLGQWRALQIIDLMERDFGVPVIASKAVQSWGIQNYLHVREPQTGHGRLLAEMPLRKDERW